MNFGDPRVENYATHRWNGKTLSQCLICSFTSKYPHNVIRHANKFHNINYAVKDLKLIPVTQENVPSSRKGPRSVVKNSNEKVYYVLPRPKKGKWIVILERVLE